MPNHPSATHQPMPDPSDPEVWKDFKENPDGAFLDTVSSRVSPDPLPSGPLRFLRF